MHTDKLSIRAQHPTSKNSEFKILLNEDSCIKYSIALVLSVALSTIRKFCEGKCEIRKKSHWEDRFNDSVRSVH